MQSTRAFAFATTPWGSACTFLAFQVRVKLRRCGKSFAYCAHRHDVATPFDHKVALIYSSGVARTAKIFATDATPTRAQ